VSDVQSEYVACLMLVWVKVSTPFWAKMKNIVCWNGNTEEKSASLARVTSEDPFKVDLRFDRRFTAYFTSVVLSGRMSHLFRHQ